MNSSLLRISKNPALLFLSLGHRSVLNWIDDKTYLKIAYWIKMGKKLNLDNPQTYNEKLQWLKLYDRNPNYTNMVDKCEVKNWVAKIIGKEYIIPTLGIWNHFDEIDFGVLPKKFVLKCTHDSGGIVICKDKNSFDKKSSKKKIESCLRRNFFWGTREWPYKNIKPRIIAEEYVSDESGDLTDYKYFCFNGEPKAMFIASDRASKIKETKFDFFDMNFYHLPFINGHPNAHRIPNKPKKFELMKFLASKISKGIPHVRIDLYETNDKVYFGEMTFTHWSGLVPFEPDEWDYTFGSWIKLPMR